MALFGSAISLSPEGETLFRRLGTFRPSDRQAFVQVFQTSSGRQNAHDALVAFVLHWEKSDWLEEYSIERIGKWFGRHAPRDLVDELRKWCARKAKSQARQALAKGIAIGVATPVDTIA